MYQGDDAIKPAQCLVACDVLQNSVVAAATGPQRQLLANSCRLVA